MFFEKETRYYHIYEVSDFFDTYIMCEWGNLKNKKPTGRSMHFVDESGKEALLARLYAKRFAKGYSVIDDFGNY